MFMYKTRLSRRIHSRNNENADAIDKGESPTILGDGSEVFDFVSVEDCALANICAMKQIIQIVYNVGTVKEPL